MSLPGAPRARALTPCSDVGIESECRRLVADSIAALGGLDIIVSNAVSAPCCARAGAR